MFFNLDVIINMQWLAQRLIELKALEVKVNEHPDKQISQTDPDARLMKTYHIERQVCTTGGETLVLNSELCKNS